MAAQKAVLAPKPAPTPAPVVAAVAAAKDPMTASAPPPAAAVYPALPDVAVTDSVR